MDLHSSVVAGQFIVDRVEGILIAIQQDKYRGLQCDNLSAEFRAHRTPSTGNQNTLGPPRCVMTAYSASREHE